MGFEGLGRLIVGGFFTVTINSSASNIEQGTGNLE
jgi:hypothetical protein